MKWHPFSAITWDLSLTLLKRLGVLFHASHHILTLTVLILSDRTQTQCADETLDKVWNSHCRPLVPFKIQQTKEGTTLLSAASLPLQQDSCFHLHHILSSSRWQDATTESRGAFFKLDTPCLFRTNLWVYKITIYTLHINTMKGCCNGDVLLCFQ